MLGCVARSFDINKPGTTAKDSPAAFSAVVWSGGELEVGDDIEIRPGREVEEGGQSEYVLIQTSIRSLQAGGETVDTVTPGGLLGVGTKLDPC